MDEIKFIEEKINEIKESETFKSLPKLEKERAKIQDIIKTKEEELSIIPDKESGFYKDIQKDIEENDTEFRKILAERQQKNNEITKMIEESKIEILNELEEKKKIVDEHRNEVFDKIELESLKKEKEKLEKELKLNDVSRDEFDTLSDAKKNKVRKAKENYLNNKHRLAEISPKIEIMELLGDVSPKTKFLQIDRAMKSVKENFSLDNLDKVLENTKFAEQLEEAQEKKDKIQNEIKGMSKEEFKKWYENKALEEKYKKSLEEAQIKKAEREEAISKMSKDEFGKNYNPNYKTAEEKQENDTKKEEKPKVSNYEKELSKETTKPIESEFVRNVRTTVDRIVNKNQLSEEEKKIDIKFNAKSGKYIVRDHDDMRTGKSSAIGIDEFNVKSLHNLKEALKTKFELTEEQLGKVDIYTASILAVYDKNKNSQKLSKYIGTLKQEKTKENKKQLEKSGITIKYDMKELYETKELNFREKRALIDIANINKKANVATVKKGLKTIAFECIDKIDRMLEKTKIKSLKSGEKQEEVKLGADIEDGSARTGKERIIKDLKKNSIRDTVKVENRENSIEQKANSKIENTDKNVEAEAQKIADEVKNIMQK